ncbi:MAG TPA: xanthine dehydrogenase family protein subunit M [Chloroflexota bacterium]|nr:xanthine dehydrogenase family protein subunit M [Chloroflexota bacterium]
MSDFALHKPTTLAEAVDVLGSYGGQARPIAGGTALVAMIHQGLVRPAALVRLDGISGLSGVRRDDGALHLGSLATLADIASSPAVRQGAPVLAQACGLVGNVRVRNAATIGGNVCEADYASDPPGVLCALGARVRIAGPRGEREIAVHELITDFYETSLAPDEIVSEVLVPLPPSNARCVYLKYVTRSSEDRPCVGATALLRLDGNRVEELRVAVGAVGGSPLRLPAIDATAAGMPATVDLFRHIGQAYADQAEPVADARGSAAYRARMVAVFVRRALEAAAAGDVGARRV